MEEEINWARNRIVDIERDLGALHERVRGTETAHRDLKLDMKDDVVRIERTMGDAIRSMSETVMRENAHTRGELSRVSSELTEYRRSEEQRQKQHQRDVEANHQELVRKLRNELADAKSERQSEGNDLIRKNRGMITVGVVLIVVLQQAFNHAADVLRFFDLLGGR